MASGQELKTYYVTVQIEVVMEVESTDIELAKRQALDDFDAGAYDPEVVDAWTEDEQ